LVDALHIGPLSIMVNLWANGCTVLVIFLTGNIHTSLRTTLGEKLLLGVIMEEDIDVAFDLLGGRPVDLAILLKALLLVHVFLVLSPALLFALLIVDRAGGKFASIPLAEALLELLLVLVARHVHLEESMIVMFALIVELDPHGVGRCVRFNLTLQPPSELTIAMASTGLTVTNRRVTRLFRSRVRWLIWVSNGQCLWLPANCSVAVGQVWAEAALWDAWRVWDLKAVKSSTRLCHRLVRTVDLEAAFMVGTAQRMAFVLHGMAVSHCLLVLRVALAEAVLHKAIEVLLIVPVGIIEGSLDALHKHVTDGMKSFFDIIIKFPGGLRD